MIDISFCINSMNRLHHLKQTLPINLEVTFHYGKHIEFCLVNWNSKDGMDKWIKKHYSQLINNGKLKYLYITEPKYYHMAKAKNLTHSLATKQFVCNLDADNFLTPEFLQIMNKLFSKNPNILVQGGGNGACGRLTLLKKNFLKLKGYDEEIGELWHSKEDADLINRFRCLLKFPYYTLKHSHPNLCPFIKHGPEETAFNYRPNFDGSKKTTAQMNKEGKNKVLEKYKKTGIKWLGGLGDKLYD